MFNWTTLVAAFVVAALVSLAVCILIVLTQRWHGALSLDANLTGKQKFHKIPVPRIGGAALVLGVASAAAWVHLGPGGAAAAATGASVAALIGSSLPVFAIGLVEDLTRRVSVRMRLGLTLASALLAWCSLDAVLARIGLPFVDELLAFAPLAVLLTAVAVAGITNAVNIIDGFHGIAGSTVIVILSGIAFLSWRSGDALVLELALLGMGATLGFLLVNYPLGMLFMGDGGAYFLGFWCAELAVLLVWRQPDISPWQVLAICAYPVIEVLYSMFRKKVLRGMSPTMPDRLHLHMLIYRRGICRLLARDDRRPWLRNAAVNWALAPWQSAWAIAAVALGAAGPAAGLLLGLHALAYVAVYVRLLRGRWYYPALVMRPLRRRVRAVRTVRTRIV
ncbi:MraY family glycosyltransferase [Massilia sp. GCM10023247]|uniref:MraY family glycosyltransferase n=1 Tax=Massilia sp. GCM10023247 TaxID=3252643 RepID=UPI003617095A